MPDMNERELIRCFEEIAKYNRGITGLFTGVLRAIAGFVASLGGFAIAIVLFGAIAERRRDLSLLRAAGAEGRQIVSLVLIDAVAIAAISVVVGLGLGFACASPTTDILREQYGWVLDQQWFAVELPYLAIGALVSALLGAIGPARLAFRSVPSEAFAPE